MVGVWIALGMLVFLLFLLCMPAVVRLDVDTLRDRSDWKLSWIGIALFTSAEKGLFQRMAKHFPRKKKQRADTSEKTENTSKKINWKRYWYLFRKTSSILPRPLRRFWKGISVHGLTIGIRVGCFDAKECALTYGTVNAALYTALGLIQSMMRVRVKQVQVCCAFGTDRMDWIIRGKLHVCPLAALVALFSFAVGMAMQKKQHAPEQPEPQNQSETHIHTKALQ